MQVKEKVKERSACELNKMVKRAETLLGACVISKNTPAPVATA